MKIRHKIEVHINIDDVTCIRVKTLSGMLLTEFYGLNLQDAVKQYNEWMKNN